MLQTFIDGQGQTTQLHAPRDIVISPDDAHVYVASQEDNAITVFDRDPLDGQLTVSSHVKDGLLGATGLIGLRGLAISPDGNSLYSSGWVIGTHNIAVLDRDPVTGQLEVIQTFIRGVNIEDIGGVWDVEVSPDGANVYVCAHLSGTISVFDRDPQSGMLTLTEQVSQGEGWSLGSVRHLVISPDGGFLYATAFGHDRVSALIRDPISGLLTHLDSYVDNGNGGDSLDGVQDIAISADGLHVYTTSHYDHGLTVFNRDVVSGELTFAVRYRHGVDGVTNFVTLYGVILSPDQEHLYVASRGSEAITVLNRNPMVPTLSFAHVFHHGEMGALLDGVHAMVISADGDNLYAISWDWSYMTVFARND